MERRSELSKARRILVKVGSRALAENADLPVRLAEQFAELRGQNKSVVLVSSGAVAFGMERLGYPRRPQDIGQLQAAAAVGQSALMHEYDRAFRAQGLTAAQLLLTHADLADRGRVNNARRVLSELVSCGAIPIINENDTVATDEIRFGDNDQLAAMVAPLVDADAVVFLTNVDGVLDENGQRIPSFAVGQSIKHEVSAAANLGRGGIESKIRAAHAAQRCGADVVVGPAGKPGALTDILAGKDIGTLFPRGAAPLAARKHWILFTLRPKGDLLLDAGAVSALLHDKRSLLAVGILGVRGGFFPGDAVRLLTAHGQELGRGLARLGALDVARAAGRRREDLEAQFGEGQDVVVVHRDDLVVHPSLEAT